MVSLGQRSGRLAAVVSISVLSACSVVPLIPPPAGTPAATPEPAVVAEPETALIVPQQPQQSVKVNKAPSSLPAAKRMRQLASAEGEKGDYRRAVTLLERALRISPRDPETYYELARMHLLLENTEQALQLAERGLSLNPSASQRTRLERLVDACREKLTA